MAETSEDKSILGLPAGARLVSATLIDARSLRYESPADTLIAVFDGDVALEPSCYEVSGADQHIQMKRPPAFDIKFLVAAAA